MTSNPGPSSAAAMAPGATTTQEFTVRVPIDRKKKLSMMRFAGKPGVDFAKSADVSIKMERENNLKEFKSAHDLDQLPKFGAGSEYGRDLKEEARRKKYGIITKKYDADQQPWLLKVGSGKQAQKFRGVREGTISENTSYYIFTQCADGAFEAFPVEEWYNFSPMIRYKYLNSEEAEEEFSRRDKTLNYFNIMLKKRVKNEPNDAELDGEEKAAKSKISKAGKKKGKDFMLTDRDDWAELSDDDEDPDEDRDGEDDEKREDKKKSKSKKGKGKGKARVKNSKHNSDDEAVEESDEGDFDDREVDYISDTSSDGLSEPEEEDKKNEEQGVADEDGLRNILNSDDEEDEDNKEEDKNDDDEKKDDDKKEKSTKGGSESSSSSSDSDSDIDKDEKFTSALLMGRDKGGVKKQGGSGDGRSIGADATDASKGLKRKAEEDGPTPKKSKKDHSVSYGGSSSSEGITEDAVRRYLQRKPMTTRDLLAKFRSKKLNLTKEQMTHAIAQLLKRINPERTMINKKLYLSLKNPQ